MPGNPQIAQGVLNLLRGALSWTDVPTLNVSASYLGPSGIRVRPSSPATAYRPTLTGGVPSPSPQQHVTIMIPVLKTQTLGSLYKRQLESNTFMGDCTVRSDAAVFDPYNFTNVSLTDWDEQAFDGSTPVYMIHAEGFYLVNNTLWDI